MTATTAKNAYRPDIDGLRAIAVLAVVITHGFPALLPNGFIGVDIFFVISGFLISRIIFSELEANRFSFLDFYVRRIRRILPALIVVLIATLVLGWFILLPSEFTNLGRHVFSAALFASNFRLLNEVGYFDTDANYKPLLHLWSLGVEEQFYIFWPLLAALAWRRINFLGLTIALGLISFLTYLWLSTTHPEAAFYLPFTRFWELMAGGALAYVSLHHPEALRRHTSLQSAAGITLIALALIATDRAHWLPGTLLLLPIAGAFLLISAGSRSFVSRRILGNPAMVAIGRISYPLYLWHWPLLSFVWILDHGQMPAGAAACAILLAFVLAWATYAGIERRVRFNALPRFAPAGLCAVLLLAGTLGIGVRVMGGLPARAVAMLNPVGDGVSSKAGNRLRDCAIPSLKAAKVPVCLKDLKSDPVYAVLGDSKTTALLPGLLNYSGPNDHWLFIGGNGDDGAPIPLLSSAAPYRGFQPMTQAASNAIIANPSIKVVILATATRSVFQTKDRFLRDLPSSPNQAIALEGLNRMIGGLVTAGKKVVLVVDNPTLADPEKCRDRITQSATINQLFNLPNPRCSLSLTQHYQRTAVYLDLIKQVGERWGDRITIYDPTLLLCDQAANNCATSRNGHQLYSFTDHISDYSAGLIAQQLIPIVHNLALSPPS